MHQNGGQRNAHKLAQLRGDIGLWYGWSSWQMRIIEVVKNHRGQILEWQSKSTGADYGPELEADKGKQRGDEKLSIS